MKLRILLQSLWLLKYDWDDELDEKLKEKFNLCILQLPLLREVSVPRWTGSVVGSQMTCVGFCDASNDAFAAVIYSRVSVE